MLSDFSCLDSFSAFPETKLDLFRPPYLLFCSTGAERCMVGNKFLSWPTFCVIVVDALYDDASS